MIDLVTATAKFDEVLNRISARTRSDSVYLNIRGEAEKILSQYKKNPLNTHLVEKCSDLVHRLENLNADQLSDKNFLRSRSNVVYISALSKRTHYAAYMAGVWRSDPSISKPFKVWMHNSAADGAIDLYDALYPVVRDNKASAEYQLLSIYGEGAIQDAERFLDWAERELPECAVTRYNKAKVDIYHVARDRVRRGVENLESIPCPTDNSEAPELLWHVDNWESFRHRQKDEATDSDGGAGGLGKDRDSIVEEPGPGTHAN